MQKFAIHIKPVAFLILFVLLIVSGCRRELNTTGPLPPGGVNDNEKVTGGITGNVVDESDSPVMGATVTSGTNTTTTDRYGSFRFSNISLSKANGAVKVVLPGYFNAYRTFVSVAGRINNVRIKLIPKTNSGNFSAGAGGTVNITGGAKLVLPANAVTNPAGAAYSGTVNVAMTWIDPSSPDLPNVLMGDLRGITTSGAEMGLSTFGMIGVELTDMGGQPLKIASGKTAELTFPIPSSLLGAAPSTIDLWHFDEATARWKQEGTASKTGNNYVANVSHFSFWNCDVPFPLIDLCMNLVNSNNIPLINVQVRIKRLVNGTYGYGRTDSSGNLCGKVPKDEALLLEVLGLCNSSVVYFQNIGPFNANTSLPTISVNIPPTNNLVITGTITNCSGANVTYGAALIYVAGGNQYTVPVTNGTFTLSLLRCIGSNLYFTVVGRDYSSWQESSPVGAVGTTGISNVGTIQACGSNSFEFIEYLIDGVPFNFIEPPGNISSNDQPGFPPYSTRTNITGSGPSIIPGTINMTTFSISNNNLPANGLPLNNFGIYTHEFGTYQIVTVNPTANITAFGQPLTGFIEGNFAFQMNFSGAIRNAVCTFKARRN